MANTIDLDALIEICQREISVRFGTPVREVIIEVVERELNASVPADADDRNFFLFKAMFGLNHEIIERQKLDPKNFPTDANSSRPATLLIDGLVLYFEHITTPAQAS